MAAAAMPPPAAKRPREPDADMPKSQELHAALRKLIDSTPNSLATFTTRTLLMKVEPVMNVKAGRLSNKEQNQANWDFANDCVVEVLENMLDETPDLVEKLDEQAPPPGEEGQPEGKRRRTGASKRASPLKKPQKARDASQFFLKAKKDEVRKANPDMKGQDIAAKVNELWARVSEAERARYEQLAEEDQRRFDREQAAYASAGAGGGGAAEERRLPAVPKRPQSAFFHYVAQKRAGLIEANPEFAKKPALLAKKAGEMWKVADADERKSSEAAASDDKQRYEREKKQWETDNGCALPKRVMTKKQKEAAAARRDARKAAKAAEDAAGEEEGEEDEEEEEGDD